MFSIKHICVKVDDTIEEERNKEIDKIIVDCIIEGRSERLILICARKAVVNK